MTCTMGQTEDGIHLMLDDSSKPLPAMAQTRQPAAAA